MTSPLAQSNYTKKSFFDDINVVADNINRTTSKNTTAASDTNWGDQLTLAGSKANTEIAKLNQMLNQRISMQEVMENEIQQLLEEKIILEKQQCTCGKKTNFYA